MQFYRALSTQLNWCKLLVVLAIAIFLNGTLMAQDEASYNRFQFHKYNWRVYHGKAFQVYFPADAADSLSRFIAKETPDAISRIKKATLKELPKNINIVVYPSIDQLYETNIGARETQDFTFPTFAYKGMRIVLAYSGSYADIRFQLDEGLARAMWETQMKDGDKEDDGKQSTSKTKGSANTNPIPFWFKEGAIRYFAHGWTIADEDNFRASFERNNFSSFQQILNYEPRLGGQAFCYFLAQHFYPKVVAQACFQVKKKKSVARGLRLVTKCEMDTLYAACFTYYQQRFRRATPLENVAAGDIKFHHRKGIIQQVLLNEGKSIAAYVLLENGNRNVYLYDIKKKQDTRLASYKLPPWLNDHSMDLYPLIRWHTGGTQLYVAMPRKGKLSIARYQQDGKLAERNIIVGVDGITSFQPLSDRDFLLTAYRKGQTDIVSYDDNHEQFTAYTDDIYDDAQPVLTGNRAEALFVSDRPLKQEERKTFFIGVGFKKDTLRQGIYAVKDKQIRPVIIDSAVFVRYDKLVRLNDSMVLGTTTKYGREDNILLNYRDDKLLALGAYKPYQYLPGKNEILFFKSENDSM